MLKARRLTALLPFLCLAPIASLAAPFDLDLGMRAVIYDENYDLGVGGELGAVVPVTPKMDMGLHLNYTSFASKTESFSDVNEFGGYFTAYFLPAIDQGFSLRIGPHLGYSRIGDFNFLDLGGDVMAVFKVTPMMSFYGAFIPSFFIGEESQSLIRIGFGLEYRVGG